MGDRSRQRRYLLDLLQCLPVAPLTFVELACGTGYFTEVFFEAFPTIRGLATDGSEAMLDKARARSSADQNLELRCELLQDMDWSRVHATSLVFSAFALHHLSGDEKMQLFEGIFEHIEPGGRFILFDSFRPEDPTANAIIERLTCIEIERRVREERGSAPPLEQIIARDRESKTAEGDRESSFETHLRWFRELGFETVAPIFLDLRMGGIVAIKP